MLPEYPAVICPACRIGIEVSELVLMIIYVLVGPFCGYDVRRIAYVVACSAGIRTVIYIYRNLCSAPIVCLVFCVRGVVVKGNPVLRVIKILSHASVSPDRSLYMS